MKMEASQKDVTAPATDTQAPAPAKRRYVIEGMASEHYYPTNLHKKDPERTKRLDEALDLLMGWPNWSLWPFKIACPVTAMSAAVPGIILNSTLRKAFVLGRIGQASSYLACAGMPAMVSGASHFALISSDILQQTTACSVCVQVRAVSLQVAAGIVYPFFLAPVVNLWFGSRIKHLYLPRLTKEPKAVLSLLVDEFKNTKVKNRLVFAGIAQIVLAMGITYFEQESFHSVLKPIIDGEAVIRKETRYKNPAERGY